MMYYVMIDEFVFVDASNWWYLYTEELMLYIVWVEFVFSVNVITTLNIFIDEYKYSCARHYVKEIWTIKKMKFTSFWH